MTELRPPHLLEVGRFGRPHGVRGRVHVNLSTDRPERVAVGARLWCEGWPGGWVEIVESFEASGRPVVGLAGVDDRNTIERLVNRTIWAEPLVDPDAVWVHEVIGAEVIDQQGTARGRCVAVVANPADDLLELDSGALVPGRFVARVEHVVDRVVVHVDAPEGLFDLDEA